MQAFTMAIIGFQHTALVQDASESRRKLLGLLQSPSPQQEDVRPVYVELASYIDPSHYHNEAAFTYWSNNSSCSTWAGKSGFGAFWADLKPGENEVSWFLELLFPTLDCFETIFPHAIITEGAVYMRLNVSGPMGSMFVGGV